MIQIKMKMPKRCADCIFCLNQNTGDYGSFGDCLLLKNKEVDTLSWSRNKNCPLIEVRGEKAE